jgi:hypothetical protein
MSDSTENSGSAEVSRRAMLKSVGGLTAMTGLGIEIPAPASWEYSSYLEYTSDKWGDWTEPHSDGPLTEGQARDVAQILEAEVEKYEREIEAENRLYLSSVNELHATSGTHILGEHRPGTDDLDRTENEVHARQDAAVLYRLMEDQAIEFSIFYLDRTETIPVVRSGIEELFSDGFQRAGVDEAEIRIEEQTVGLEGTPEHSADTEREDLETLLDNADDRETRIRAAIDLLEAAGNEKPETSLTVLNEELGAAEAANIYVFDRNVDGFSAFSNIGKHAVVVDNSVPRIGSWHESGHQAGMYHHAMPNGIMSYNEHSSWSPKFHDWAVTILERFLKSEVKPEADYIDINYYNIARKRAERLAEENMRHFLESILNDNILGWESGSGETGFSLADWEIDYNSDEEHYTLAVDCEDGEFEMGVQLREDARGIDQIDYQYEDRVLVQLELT